MQKRNTILNIIKNFIRILLSVLISLYIMGLYNLETFSRIMLFFLIYILISIILEPIFKKLKK